MSSLPNDKPIIPEPVLGSPGVYDVPSRSRPGTTHRVNANGDGSCTCESFTYRGHCDHLDVCQDAERRQEQTRAMARPRPLPRSLAVTADECCKCKGKVVMLGTNYCAFCAPGVLTLAAVSR